MTGAELGVTMAIVCGSILGAALVIYVVMSLITYYCSCCVTFVDDDPMSPVTASKVFRAPRDLMSRKVTRRRPVRK